MKSYKKKRKEKEERGDIPHTHKCLWVHATFETPVGRVRKIRKRQRIRTMHLWKEGAWAGFSQGLVVA